MQEFGSSPEEAPKLRNQDNAMGVMSEYGKFDIVVKEACN